MKAQIRKIIVQVDEVHIEMGQAISPPTRRALAMAVIGFTSDNLMPAIRDWRRGDHSAALLFIPNWTSYMLIIVIASSTASIIGVSELVSRCNTVINATGNTELLLPVYLYACACFFLFCYPLTRCMQWTREHLANRIHRKAEQ